MLTIRLQRVGRKNDPSFRVILVESKRAAKTGNFNELLGSYDARSDRVALKADRIKHWIGMGATVSDTVHNLLISQKIIEGKKINVLPQKSPPKKEEEVATPTPEGVGAPTESVGEAPVVAKGDNVVAEEKASA
ncbi:30S ribosomal protein S16 [Candidatus Adlerbacteria bacterium RIFCSPHIGHO2_12_FULL_53_18]|uniref:30S ribosomal protein S16 n=1 Tax=Candidatus Adlerbacteria bacterium RIFCSPHIGHO2_12_FULL_53_18 TaxID=1797242 RepID=A0A1F4XSE5_9BACT|nr:MAG: 30S ribosomal protein S16 [Candidatus Adlerbacteria bacterium RIFCSPHIGHO2_12_FULL_53_18]